MKHINIAKNIKWFKIALIMNIEKQQPKHINKTEIIYTFAENAVQQYIDKCNLI